MPDSINYALLVVVTLIIGAFMQFAWMIFSNHLEKNRLEKRLEEVSIAIGKNAKDEENTGDTINYLKGKFSPSKFENRITDAIGAIVKVVHWPVSILITLWYFSMVAGRIFGFMYIESIVLWVPMIMQLLFSVAILVFSVLIKVIFGRYPGEARGFNREYVKTIK